VPDDHLSERVAEKYAEFSRDVFRPDVLDVVVDFRNK